jgi:glycine oxidase
VAQEKVNQNFDVAVVGAGVIGLACAWRLAASGERVVVLERDEPGAGTTRVAAGMLAPVGEAEFGEEALLEQTAGAAALYQRFVAEVEEAAGVEVGFRRCGALHVALDRDEAAALRRRHDLHRRLELDSRWLSPRECRRLEPGLASSLFGGFHVPGEAAVDPRALARALLAAARKEGAEVWGGAEVVSARVEGGTVSGLRLTGGREVEAGLVVVAAGAWSGAAEWLPEEARPSVRPVKGQILELRGDAREPVCERIVASERVYVVPRPDGRLVVGATVEERGFDTSVTAGGVYELLREAYRLLPEVAELELVEVAAGLRPATPDNLPRVGAGALENLLMATGHYRNGVLLAPLTAQRVLEAATRRRPALEPVS